MPRKKFNPKKHHDIKHYKRLRRELMTMREGIIRSFEELNLGTYSPDYMKRLRETVSKDGALLNHIDAVIRATNTFLKDDTFKLPPIPRVTLRKLVIKKTSPESPAKETFDFTITG